MQSRLSASPTTHTQPHCTRSRLTTCSQTSCSPLSRSVCAGHNSLTRLQAATECDSRCQLCLACARRGKADLPPTQLLQPQLLNNVLLSLPYIIFTLYYDYMKFCMIYHGMVDAVPNVKMLIYRTALYVVILHHITKHKVRVLHLPVASYPACPANKQGPYSSSGVSRP